MLSVPSYVYLRLRKLPRTETLRMQEIACVQGGKLNELYIVKLYVCTESYTKGNSFLISMELLKLSAKKLQKHSQYCRICPQASKYFTQAAADRYLVTSELLCCKAYAKVTALLCLVDGHAQWMSMPSETAYITWTPQKPTLFDGHYLLNRSTLDIGVLGYIGIV